MRKITEVTAVSIFLTILVIAGLPQLSYAAEIYGCVLNRNGALRIVSDMSQCTSKESPISWNQSGPQGPAGADGYSPTVSMSGDQITVDGVITGPHLTGPEGPAGSISGVSAIARAVVAQDGSIIASSPGISASKLEVGNYEITLPEEFNTFFPVVPICVTTAMDPYDIELYWPVAVNCEYRAMWGGSPSGGWTLSTGVICLRDSSTQVDSRFSIICAQ